MQLQLSISVLVSDRLETVDKCLNSLNPILKNIPSELIVVYTGTDSQSLEIAKRYTSNIIPFQWCDDFSAARNAGLEKASGEWFMFIDDDEWFESSAKIIEFFSSGEYKNYGSAEYTVRNYTDLKGVGYHDTRASRLVKRNSNTKFKGIVHELLTPCPKPIKLLDCYAHHYSYAEEYSGGEHDRTLRNIPLLKKQIELEPGEIRYQVQLVQEYFKTEEYEKAEQNCRTILELPGATWDKPAVHWVALSLINALSAQGENESMLEEGMKLISSHKLWELFEMNLCFRLVSYCLPFEKYEIGVECARRFAVLSQTMQQHPEKWERQQVLAMNQANTVKKSYQILSSGLLCASHIKDTAAMEFLLKSALLCEYIDQEELFQFVEEWKQKFPEQKMEILGCFQNAESDAPFIHLQKALFFEITGQLDAAQMQYLLCKPDAISYSAYQLILMALKNGYDLPPLMKDLDLEDWRDYAQEIAAHLTAESYLPAIAQSQKLFNDFPIHKMVLLQKIFARVLYDKSLTKQKFIELTSQYCDIVLKLNHVLYREELFKDSLEFCLPKECRAAIGLQKIMDLLKNEKIPECIAQIRQLIKKYPALSYITTILLDYIEETYPPSSQGNQGTKNQEFREMGEKVKEAMKTLADKEQYQEALKIAEELEKLLPDDVEVIRYKKMLKKMVQQ